MAVKTKMMFGVFGMSLFVIFAVHMVFADEIVKVVETYPMNNQTEVPPTVNKIIVKFSVPMKKGSYSIVVAGEGETPEISSEPIFEDEYTCIISVKLKPNTLYSLGINSKTRKGFVSKKGIPCEPFVLTFRTASNKIEASKSKDVYKKDSSGSKSIIIYDFYIEKTQGAFWLLVPRGWNTQGGISQSLFQSPKLDFAVSHPKDFCGIRFIPGARYLQMSSNTFYPPGTADDKGNIYLPYMEPIDYLRRVVVPSIYSDNQVRETNARELPEAAQALKRFYDMIGVVIPQIKCASLGLETSRNGRVYLNRLVVYVLITPLTNIDIVWETQIILISELKEKIAECEPLLMTALSSFQINPNWVIALNRAEQVRSEIRMRYQKEILEIQERMYRNRAQVNDEIAHSIGLELGGQAEFKDPQSGEVVTLYSNYEKTWTNGNGTFFQTSDPNFNPNDPEVQRKLGLSGDFRLMKQK